MDQQQAVEFIQKYIADIISFFGENVDIEVDVVEDMINVNVGSSELNSILIGRNADNLRSLQFIASMALRQQNSEITRVNIDIADYKKQRAEKTAERAREWMREVSETGKRHVARINAADRRVVHRVADEFDDIDTYSEGEGRDRRIVIEKK